MTTCTCFIQEGLIPGSTEQRLAGGIREIVKRNSIDEDVQMTWITIPEGYGWTAGKPSTSSVVSLMTRDLKQSLRIQVMRSLCDLWIEHTRCDINEIIVSVLPLNQE
ncbi:MAG: hypothetical protein AAGI44_03775 [Pseudomonadota bacterium]